MFENINYVELLAAGVGAMVVGFVWYSTAVFGKAWAKSAGLSQSDLKEGMKDAPKMYGLMFLGAFVQAFVLSILIGVFGASDYMSAATVAFWTWLGFFAAATLLNGALWEGNSWKMFCIKAGYWIINLIVIAGILTKWQ